MAGGGGGGPAPPPKQEELQPHPVRDQLPSISYCITSPPPWRECLFNLIYLKDIYLVYANASLLVNNHYTHEALLCITLHLMVVNFYETLLINITLLSFLFLKQTFISQKCNCFQLRTCFFVFLNAAEAILLGFQHYLVMLGTTVLIPTSLVPQMGGGNVNFDMDNNNCTAVLLFLVSILYRL